MCFHVVDVHGYKVRRAFKKQKREDSASPHKGGKMDRKEKAKRGRPVEKPMPERIPDTPQNIARAMFTVPGDIAIRASD